MKKILMVEDDVSLYNIYSTELQLKGYQVTNVADGMLAVDTVRSEAPDLVLLDLMLPGKNGLEILHEIKSDDDLKNTKVVMLTNYGDDTNVKKALEYGAEDFMLKYNIVPSELSQKVGQYLGEATDPAITLTNS